MIKTPEKIKYRRNISERNQGYLSLQLTYSMVKRLKDFPLRSGTTQKYPLLLLLFNIIMEILTRAISQEKEAKKHQNWKGRSRKRFTKRISELEDRSEKLAE